MGQVWLVKNVLIYQPKLGDGPFSEPVQSPYPTLYAYLGSQETVGTLTLGPKPSQANLMEV
jgi:hypothetical protein